jgi:hypothetical protein
MTALDFLHLVLAITGLMAIPVLPMLALVPQTRKVATALLAVYLAAYGLFSYHGEYILEPGKAGEIKWWPWGSRAAADNPGRARVKPDISTLGWFYWPLIEFDQRFVHRPPR